MPRAHKIFNTRVGGQLALIIIAATRCACERRVAQRAAAAAEQQQPFFPFFAPQPHCHTMRARTRRDAQAPHGPSLFLKKGLWHEHTAPAPRGRAKHTHTYARFC